MSRAVIDQPGIRIIGIGLALSLFLGLALKSQISSSRVKEYLDSSIARLQSDFYVDYGSAEVNLSNWGMPLPALSIQNIRMSPKSNICQSSQIFVNELEVPISVSVLLGFNKTIPKIRIKEIELRLNDIEKCLEENNIQASLPKEHKSESDSGSSSTNIKKDEVSDGKIENIFKNETQTELKEVYIEKLKIISSKKTDQPILLKQINLDLGYADNKLSSLKIKSKLNAFKDIRSDVYFLNANFNSEFISKPESNEIETHLNVAGKLLDGDIKLAVYGLKSTKKISYELGVEQVSIKALAPFINNPEAIAIFEKTPISVNFASKGDIKTEDKLSIKAKVLRAVINVDSGFLKLNELEFNYVDNKLTLMPFTLSVEAVSLSKLKNIEALKKQLDSFESLGELSGQVHFASFDDVSAQGSLKNILAIFSNKGRRDLQRIDNMDVQIAKKNSETKLIAENFVINNEKTLGRLELKHNSDRQETTAQFKLSGAVLEPKVWEQFTYVEQSPRVDLIWNYKKSKYENHSVKLHLSKINLPGMLLDNLNVDLEQSIDPDEKESSLKLSIKPGYLETDKTFLDNSVINQVLNLNKNFKVSHLTSTKTNLVFSGMDWKNVDFHLDSAFIPDKNLKAETFIDFKGTAKYRSGINSLLLIHNKLFSSKYELFTDAEDRIAVKPLQ